MSNVFISIKACKNILDGTLKLQTDAITLNTHKMVPVSQQSVKLCNITQPETYKTFLIFNPF